MADKPASEKTEQPTPRRLEKAREKGQVAKSQELPAAVSVVTLLIVLALCGQSLIQWMITQMRQGTSCRNSVFADAQTLMGFAGAKIGGMIGVIFPVFLALFAGSVLSCVVVTGLNFSSQSVKLKWESLNPVKGFTNLINARSFVKLLISIAKITVVSLIVWFYINGRSEQLASLRWNYSGELLPAIAALVLGMMVRISVALLIIAAIDAIYQRYKYIQDLKMTKQEVKEENRDTEGSPELKARIRQIQSEMAKKRMLQEVPKADVVLTNPTHYAVALKYDAKEMDCPVVVAKGADNLAQKIRETASSAGVPVIRRPQLTRTLYSAVECGDPVPQTLFVAVAEVLAMIYRRKQGK